MYGLISILATQNLHKPLSPSKELKIIKFQNVQMFGVNMYLVECLLYAKFYPGEESFKQCSTSAKIHQTEID